MKALSVVDKEKMELVTIEKPKEKENEVLIQVAYCGICGSDLPRYFEGAVHNFPQVLGHEFSGKVVSTGKKVQNVSVGDKVTVAPLVPCGECAQCEKSNPAMCTNYSFVGSRQQGALAEFVAVPANNCLIIPESLDLQQAALIEPLTVAIHGIERTSLKAGEKVMVLGAGTIGLLTLLSLKAKGVGEVIVVDLNTKKLDLAKKIGADICINPIATTLEEYFSKESLPSTVIETAGSFITQKQAIEFVEKTGNVVFVGTSTRDVVLEPELFEKILRGELNVTGSWMSYSAPFPGYEWRAAINYLATGKINVQPLITGIFSLEDKEIPFKKIIEKDSEQVKLLYKIDGGL